MAYTFPFTYPLFSSTRSIIVSKPIKNLCIYQIYEHIEANADNNNFKTTFIFYYEQPIVNKKFLFSYIVSIISPFYYYCLSMKIFFNKLFQSIQLNFVIYHINWFYAYLLLRSHWIESYVSWWLSDCLFYKRILFAHIYNNNIGRYTIWFSFSYLFGCNCLINVLGIVCRF